MSNKLEKGEHFNLNVKRPKVLLLGNGIAQAFGKGKSWNKFLEAIKGDNDFKLGAEKYQMPMPLKATMLTENSAQSKIKEFCTENQDWGLSVNKKQKEFLQKLLVLNFDYILTTNYSCEIECASLNTPKILKKHIKEEQKFYTTENEKGSQRKFYITTFNKIQDKLNGGEHDIWHIHGDVALPDSIAFNNEYYGKLVGRYQKWITENHKNGAPEEIKSWIDAFLYGDLYILGFGMNFDETDLWWLLEYKAKNKNFGKTVFFDKDLKNAAKEGSRSWCKRKLLEVLKVKIEDCGYQNNNYKEFYEKACDNIKKEIGEKKQVK